MSQRARRARPRRARDPARAGTGAECGTGAWAGVSELSPQLAILRLGQTWTMAAVGAPGSFVHA